MDIIIDILNNLLQGNWKYVIWFVLGLLTIGTLRILYAKLQKKEAAGDETYLREHPGETPETLRKKSHRILLSLLAVLFLAMPLGMVLVVQVFKDNETIGPEIPLLIILGIFLLSLVFTIIQAVRRKRILRRIKKMEEA